MKKNLQETSLKTKIVNSFMINGEKKQVKKFY